MKAGQSLKCLFWAILYCVLYIVSATEEDLMDFDFADLKEIDWNYENDNSNETTARATTSGAGIWKTNGHSSVLFDEKDDDLTENQVHPFDWREKVLRNALSKALTNRALRQKFVEVMPILRVLSKQQRLALSAIISAQVNAKKGQELKLEQVRMMFGDDKKLLIPIVYDIANLVGNSARKYLQFTYEVQPAERRVAPQIERRKLDLLSSTELDAEDLGALPSASMPESSLEDFFSEVSDDVLDPQSINEELQASSEKAKSSTRKVGSSKSRGILTRRARREVASASTQFVHKLIRSIPLSVNEEDLQRGAAGHSVQLNTTSFAVPNEGKVQLQLSSTLSPFQTPGAEDVTSDHVGINSTPSYQKIEDLAFASLNGTEISLNDDVVGRESDDSDVEPLPNPEELIAGPRYRINGNKVRLIRPKIPPAAAKRKRVQLLRPQQRLKGILPSGSPTAISAASVPVPKKCERFTASMCIRTEDYPLDQIMGSIRRHKNAMTALLAEYHDKPLNLDFSDEFDDFSYTKRRREDETANGAGGMCQTIVRYARPQKARSASGEWKFIVNTGQHTQTLRLEKCSNPEESCSYLAHNYRSHCAQIYNYHRLLSWDKTRGLHVDIFKVPTCCSCQIDGYRQQFPPLDTIKSKEFTPAYSQDPYAAINDELDYNDEEDNDDLGLHYSHNLNQSKRDSNHRGFDANELQLGSRHVRTKVHAPNPTVGSYLTPPGSNEYDTRYAYKAGHHHHHHQHHHHVPSSASVSSKTAYTQLPRRRPYKSYSQGLDSESRADLDIAPSEKHTDKEVNIYGTTHAIDKTRQVQQKRKRIYSVPHTANTSSSSSSIGGSKITTTTSTNVSPLSPQSHGHGYSYEHGPGTFNGHGGYGQSIAGGSSTTSSATYQTSSTPSFHATSTRKNNFRGGGTNGKAKPRYRTGTSAAPSSSTSESFVPSATALPATESTNSYRQPTASSTSPSASVYPPIYQIGSKYNPSNGNSAPISGSKRINYSYHPIIDFFENSSKHVVITSSSPTSSGNIEDDDNNHTDFNYREHLYPHKIPKYSSASNTKSAPVMKASAADVNSLQHYRERRIGFGAEGTGGIGGGGNSIGNSLSSGKSGRGNQLSTIASSEDNVWHPVLA